MFQLSHGRWRHMEAKFTTYSTIRGGGSSRLGQNPNFEIQAVQLYLIFVTGTTGYLWKKVCHVEKFQILIHTSVICVILCTQYILCTVSNFCLILSSVSSSLISSVLSQFTRLCEEENSTYRVVF